MHASASTPRLARGIEARGAASQPHRAFLLSRPPALCIWEGAAPSPVCIVPALCRACACRVCGGCELRLRSVRVRRVPGVRPCGMRESLWAMAYAWVSDEESSEWCQVPRCRRERRERSEPATRAHGETESSTRIAQTSQIGS